MRRAVTILIWVGWLLVLLGAVFIPAEYARTYATVISGCVVVAAAVFVVGFVALSKPSRDPETGKRRWLGLWWWLLGHTSVILLVFLNGFVFRLIVPAPDLTPQQIAQQRFSAIISSVVLLEQTWLTLFWIRQQIRTRHQRRAAMTEPEPVDPDDDELSDDDEQKDYENDWPPSA